MHEEKQPCCLEAAALSLFLLRRCSLLQAAASNAPPPSNGQLGPFQGSSEQAIATQGDSYKNILRLPPNSKDGEWLAVVLDGIWEDWDGIEIKEGKEATVESSRNQQTAAAY